MFVIGLNAGILASPVTDDSYGEGDFLFDAIAVCCHSLIYISAVTLWRMMNSYEAQDPAKGTLSRNLINLGILRVSGAAFRVDGMVVQVVIIALLQYSPCQQRMTP